jgi:hypothetical protein
MPKRTVDRDDLVEIIRHLTSVVTTLAAHVAHSDECEREPCTCGLDDVLATVKGDFEPERMPRHRM